MDWQPIETAPKDGSVIVLSWHEGGEAQESFIMQWGHIQKNGLFPRNTGMWVSPDGSMTWNGSADDGGPTHWMPLPSPKG